MEKITSILSKKEPHFHTVSPNTTAEKALGQMCSENVDHLIVVDDHENYLGLISEHDIASKVLFANKQMTKTIVEDIMDKKLPAANTDDTVERCMQLMSRHHTRFLPVFENFSFRGIICSEDLLEEAVHNRMGIFDESACRTGRFGVLI